MILKVLSLLAVILASTSCVYSQGTITGNWFDRIFIIVFENMSFDTVANTPDWKSISDRGCVLTNYYAITHPSQPNYWSMVAGDYFGDNTDNSIDMSQTILSDLMDTKGISWKAYQENFPGNCFQSDEYPYARKHNPFISFAGVRLNPTDCAKVVNADQLATDLSNGNLPQYSFYTPGLVNDGHDSGSEVAGQFAISFFNRVIPQMPAGTLIVVTWDEDDSQGSNNIYTFLLGTMISPGTTDNTKLNHYSLLKTVEDNWNLGNLGRNDIGATAFSLPATNGSWSGLTPWTPVATSMAEGRGGTEKLLFLLLLLVGNWVCLRA